MLPATAGNTIRLKKPSFGAVVQFAVETSPLLYDMMKMTNVMVSLLN
jgi:hypothetical protein